MKLPIWIAPLLLLTAAQTIQASCVLEPLHEDKAASIADLVLHAPDGGDEANRSGLGPITTRQCTLNTDLFTGPVAVAKQRYLFIVQYSGSQKWLAVYDLQQCRLHWRSKAQLGEVSLSNRSYQFTAAGKTKSIHFGATCKGRAQSK